MSIDRLELFGYLHHNIGAIHAGEGRYAEAIRCFREAQIWRSAAADFALHGVAGAAYRAASTAYQAGERDAAIARWRDAHAAMPQDASVIALGQSIATQCFNAGARAFNAQRLAEAAEALATALELHPGLEAPREPLADSLRRLIAEHFGRGEVGPALAYFDRLLDLRAGTSADRALEARLHDWLREGVVQQVGAGQVGGATRLLRLIARIDPAAVRGEVALIEPIGALARLLGEHAEGKAIEVLEAVIELHPICPSAQLSWAGAAAYEAAIGEARRLHNDGALMEAVDFCEPATRYRPGGPNRQLPHALGTLLCRRTTELLESDQPAALALHARTLRFLESSRSTGVVQG